MHKPVKRVALLALSVWMGGYAVSAAEGDLYRVKADSTLRQGPDSFYQPVVSVKPGDQAVEISGNRGWLKVRMQSGEVGWIFAADLEAKPKSDNRSGAISEAKSVTVIDENRDALLEAPTAADRAPIQSGGVSEAFVLNGYGAVEKSEAVQVAELDQSAMAATSELKVVVEKKAVAAQPEAVVAASAIEGSSASATEQTVVTSKATADPQAPKAHRAPIESGGVSEAFVLNGYGAIETAEAEKPEPAAPTTAAEIDQTTMAATAEPKVAEEKAVVKPQVAVLPEVQEPETVVSAKAEEESVSSAPQVVSEKETDEVQAAKVHRAPIEGGGVSEAFVLNGYGAVEPAEPVKSGKTASSALSEVDQTTMAATAEPKVAEEKAAVKAHAIAQPESEAVVVSAKAEEEKSTVAEQAVVSGKAADEAQTAQAHRAPIEGGGVSEAFVLNGYGAVESAEAVKPKSAAAETQAEAPPEPQETAAAMVEGDQSAVTTPVVTTTPQGVEQPVIKVSPQQAEVPAIRREEGELLSVARTTTIRSGPGSLHEVLGWAGAGAEVVVIEQQAKWLKVQMRQSGRIGWIESLAMAPQESSELVAVVPEPEPVTQVEQPIDNQAKSAEPVQPHPSQPVAIAKPAETSVDPVIHLDQKQQSSRYRFTRAANLRAGPGTRFDRVALGNARAVATEMDQQGRWIRVKLDGSGLIGWVHDSSLKPEPTEMVVAMSPPQQPDVQEVAPEVKEPAVMQSVPVTDKQDQQPMAEPEAVVTPETEQPATFAIAAEKPAAAAADVENLYIFERDSGLMAGPAARFDVVARGAANETATIIDRKDGWARVRMTLSDKVGWVHASRLAPVSGATTTARAAAKSGSTVVKTKPVRVAAIGDGGGQLYFFKNTTRLKAGPGGGFDAVAWGARNETATEIDRKGDWSRVRMTISNKVGWVPNSGLVAAETAEPLALAAYQSKEVSSGIYEVVRTSTLRSEAEKGSEVTGWIGKGEAVVVLESDGGWARVNPQESSKHVGWIETARLREISSAILAVQSGEHVISRNNIGKYRDRISHGEKFNFSYAALEQALYRVPVEELHIEIDQDDLEAILRKDVWDKSSFEIKLRTQGQTLDQSMYGRINVLGSSTRVFEKKSLLIKLDKEAGRSYGRRRIALRAMATDKALMREWISWKMMAALGMKVPEVHFVRVIFNKGERSGIFLSIEWMDQNFLAANDLDIKGDFYQAEDAFYCGDLHTTDRIDICFNKVAPPDENYSELTRMAKAVKGASVTDMDRVIERYFDSESVINWIAVNSLVTNGDTYNKNYWLYRDPRNSRWRIIPWDYNLTFGRTYDPFAENPINTFNDNFQYWYPPDVGASNPLKDKVLFNNKLRTRLEQRIRHLIGLEPNGTEATYGWFSPTVMHARIGNIAAVVGKELFKDNFLRYGEDEFKKIYETLMHYVTAHDYFLDARMFGKFKWQPVDPTAPPVFDPPLPKQLNGEGSIGKGGEALRMVDQAWGLQVAHVALSKPATSPIDFKVEIEGGQRPKYLPVGQSARRCVQRSWLVTTKGKASPVADVAVEYVQENSRRTEVPETLHEKHLELWLFDGARWKPLKTRGNEYANTLVAENLKLTPGKTQRLVACSPF